ncbi:hypothetical protein FRC09_002176 [Ceratobasidium sp. 395]|nr:hypothetical protein FRC09_002176 [Ceratobasidium sp. 395]
MAEAQADFAATSQALTDLAVQVQRLARHPAVQAGDQIQQMQAALARIEANQRGTSARLDQLTLTTTTNHRETTEKLDGLTRSMQSVEDRLVVLDKVAHARALNSSAIKSENFIYPPVRQNGMEVVGFPATVGALMELNSQALEDLLVQYDSSLGPNARKPDRLKALARYIGLSYAV